MASEHLPVLTERVVEFLSPAAPGLLIDATVGLGGHAEALLQADRPGTILDDKGSVWSEWGGSCHPPFDQTSAESLEFGLVGRRGWWSEPPTFQDKAESRPLQA